MGFNASEQMEAIKKDVLDHLVDELNVGGRNQKGNDTFFRTGTRVNIQEDMLNYIMECDRTREVAHYREIGGRFGFVKKVIRKATAFVIGPIVADQNHHNHVTVDLEGLMIRTITQQQIAIDALEQRVAELEMEVSGRKNA